LRYNNHVAIEPLWDWNLIFILLLITFMLVAIEPLWDWNDDTTFNTDCQGWRRNRTIMGLKLVRIAQKFTERDRRNRTIMGLKLGEGGRSRLRSLRRNRTIMGLKHYHTKLPFHLRNVSQSNHYGIETPSPCFIPFETNPVAIEPLWDWNQLQQDMVKQELLSQSNHYGIETN